MEGPQTPKGPFIRCRTQNRAVHKVQNPKKAIHKLQSHLLVIVLFKLSFYCSDLGLPESEKLPKVKKNADFTVKQLLNSQKQGLSV